MSCSCSTGPGKRAWMYAGALLAAAGVVTSAVAEDQAQTLTKPERDALMSRLLGRVNLVPKEGSPAFCFVENPTPEQMAFILQKYNALPPTQANDRFFTDTRVWAGAGTQANGNSGRAVSAQLTYSFPNDGVNWGDPGGVQLPNDLNARFTSLFTAANIDRGREYVRQAFASWRKYSGLTYSEVADNNSAMDNSTPRTSARGDIRMGSIPQGNGGVLAYNFFPSGGSDMTFNSDEFLAATLAGPSNNYRYFRNVAAHEHGHGLGYIHTTPCNTTKLMEPFASTAFDMVRVDDRRGAQRNYGDRYAGNNSGATATNFGNVTTPSVRSVIERNLSTNGTTGFNNSDEDWFTFTLSSTQNVVISAAPTGGSYQNGQQTGGCNPTAPATINTSSAGNLNIELRNGANGATVLQTASTAAAGATETLTANNLAAGQYWVRIFDVGPNNAADQLVQLYDMTIRVGTSQAPPLAIAGVSKRIAAATNCFFMGDLNSEPTETGNTLTAYAWDLDGDGTFENSLAQPVTQYVSNGLYNVSLRVTASNGLTDTDTIQVVVFNAGTTLTSVTPSSSAPNLTVPVTIVGTNFKGVNSAAQFSVSGTGVTVIGTPVVNGMGTQVTGLSFQIASNAPLGPRNVTVVNSDGAGGTATLTNGFTISGALPANDECSGATAWPTGAGNKPFVNNFATDSTPQSFGGTGCTGNIFNDVWYTWTATASNDVTVTTDSAGAGFSSRVAVYANVCPIGAPIQCGEFGQGYTFSAVNGTTYLFRVGSAVPNVTGSANVILTLASATGACCRPDGTCFVGTAGQCTGANSFQGAFTACTPLPCLQPSGACCFASGACTFVNQVDCGTAVGDWYGFGSVCAPNDCPQPAGACCATTGACTIALDAVSCVGTFQGPSTTCSPNPCPQPGACCATGGACSLALNAGACTGSFLGAGTVCSPNPCPQPGACCATGGVCSLANNAGACTGSFQGAGTACSPNPCPQPGACCATTGACSISNDAGSCTGTFQGPGTACSPNPCPQPAGACCAADGSCSVISQTGCNANLGTFQGAGTACSPNPCPQPSGACCSGSTCVIAQASGCTGGNQAYAGNGTTCNAPGNNTTPCCKADFNHAAGVSVQDIFDFLAAWFAGAQQADFNQINGISVQDIFDFLAAWFAGC